LLHPSVVLAVPVLCAGHAAKADLRKELVSRSSHCQHENEGQTPAGGFPFQRPTMQQTMGDDYRAGFQAGQAWAKTQASRAQLEWLEEFVSEAPPESPWWESTDGDGLEASDYLAFAVQTDSFEDDDLHTGEAFWKHVLGEEAPRIHRADFLRGFGEGAVEMVGPVSDRQ
jgi:hypothetical protein